MSADRTAPSQEACPSPYEGALSPTQAISEALAAVGRHAPAASVRRYLECRGAHVSDEQVEKVRARLIRASHPEQG